LRRPLAWPARATMTTCGAWAPARQSTTTPRSGPSRCGPRFPAASTCCWTAPGPDPRPGHRRGRQRRPGDLHNPARPARPAGVGHHRRIVRRPRRAGTGWRHSAAWSTPARCVPRSRRCCRWTRPARRWPGWRAGTSAARSCCSPGPSGTAYKPSLRRGTCRPCAQKPNSGALPAASPLTRDNAISAARGAFLLTLCHGPADGVYPRCPMLAVDSMRYRWSGGRRQGRYSSVRRTNGPARCVGG